jgi:hypothetical protein
VVVDQPVEEVDALAHLLAGQRWRVVFQFLEYRSAALGHGAPILDRQADIAEHALQAFANQHALQAFANLCHAFAGLLADLHVHDRFFDGALGRAGLVLQARQLAGLVALDVGDRMDDEAHLGVPFVQLRRHGIHQERHVVVHDLHDGVR